MFTPADNADSADVLPLPARPRRSRRADIAPADVAPTNVAKDPWEGWAPDLDAPRAPHWLQERHSPTLAVTVRGALETRSGDARRRIVDARLWEAMTPPQQDAALEIAMVFGIMSRGIGYAASDWTRALTGRGGTGNAAEIQAHLMTAYAAWARRCHQAKISHSMVLDVLVFGFSCHALDRDRRVRRGTSRGNLLKGLALYCEVKGWPA